MKRSIIQKVAKRGRNRHRRALKLESLENRALMHADVDLTSSGVLTIDANARDQSVEVIAFMNRVLVTANDQQGVLHRNAFAAGDVRSIVFNGANSVDRFTNRTNIVDKVFGHGRNDILDGGNGTTYIEGGSGNDVIRGSKGADTIYAGADSDSVYGGDGNDVIDAGAGDDRVYGDDIMGASGNDEIDGGSGRDRLMGGGGNDKIEGGDNDDYIDGGDGDDRLYGNGGNDHILGGWGADRIYGGADNDTLDGGPMRDPVVDGGAGRNTINKDIHVQLRIDDLFANRTTENDLFNDRDEVYLVVGGRKGSEPINPRRVNPTRGNDYYGLHSGERTGNISLWSGTLKPGETVDLTIGVREQDNAQLDAIKNFGEAVLKAGAAFFGGGWPAVLAGLGNGAQKFGEDLLRSLGSSVDQNIGTYRVQVKNVDGEMVVNWMPGADSKIGSTNTDAYGAHARVTASGANAKYTLRTSVREG